MIRSVTARRAGGSLAILSLMLASCTESSEPARSDDPAARPSATPAEFWDGGTCPPAYDDLLPATAGCLSVSVNDGYALRVYALLGKDGAPRSWHALLLGPGLKIERQLEYGSDYPRVEGASDLNGDGIPEWWVKVTNFASHGAPWSRMLLFYAVEDELVPLKYEGEPLGINYGGITRMGEGARCHQNRLVLLRAEAKNTRATRWRYSERGFHIIGAKAEFIGRAEGLLRLESYNDPALDPYYQVECFGEVFTPF